MPAKSIWKLKKKMPAQHKSITYKTTEIKNPFMEGQDKAFGEILSHNINELKWWRNVCGIGSLILFLVSFLFSVYAVRLQKTVPVLVNVMPSGEASYLGEVKAAAAVSVPEAAVVFQLKKFVTNFRSISTDRQVLYDNINGCYDMVTSSYEPIMTKYLQENSPFKLIGKTRRMVEIESALKTTGSSYQLDWIESTFEPGGNQKKIKMRALLTVKLLPPNDETIKKNPLGIYIENMEMTTL